MKLEMAMPTHVFLLTLHANMAPKEVGFSLGGGGRKPPKTRYQPDTSVATSTKSFWSFLLYSTRTWLIIPTSVRPPLCVSLCFCQTFAVSFEVTRLSVCLQSCFLMALIGVYDAMSEMIFFSCFLLSWGFSGRCCYTYSVRLFMSLVSILN